MCKLDFDQTHLHLKAKTEHLWSNRNFTTAKSSLVCRVKLRQYFHPLELVERSIFVWEPTLKHSLLSRGSWYNSSFQPQTTTSVVFQTPIQSIRCDDSHLLLLRLNCHTERAAFTAVCSSRGLLILTGRRSAPGSLQFIWRGNKLLLKLMAANLHRRAPSATRRVKCDVRVCMQMVNYERQNAKGVGS